MLCQDFLDFIIQNLQSPYSLSSGLSPSRMTVLFTCHPQKSVVCFTSPPHSPTSIAKLHRCCAHEEHRLGKTFLENDHSNVSVQGKTMKQVREGLDDMESVMTSKEKREKEKLHIELFPSWKRSVPEGKHCTVKDCICKARP